MEGASYSLVECRKVYEFIFGTKLPMNLPYRDAIMATVDMVGWEVVDGLVGIIRKDYGVK